MVVMPAARPASMSRSASPTYIDFPGATPVISAVIELVSVLMNRDYLGEARRTMETLGLSKHTAKELRKLLS